MIDSHVHPDFSADATGSIRDYCLRVRESELAGLCFTTHLEPDPARRERESVVVGGERRPMDSEWFSVYLTQIARARDEFPDVVILAGAEVGYEMGTDGVIADFVERHSLDYVLGAVHCLDHVAISSGGEERMMREVLASRGPEWAANRYFDYLLSAIGSGLFDCVAHLDIYRKYLLPVWRGMPEEERFLRVAEDRVGTALALMVEHEVGLEVNSAALRRGDDEPYPSWELVRRARSAGVEGFVVGSDAHCPSDLGRDLDRVAEVLAGLDIEASAFVGRKRSDQTNVDLPRTG